TANPKRLTDTGESVDSSIDERSLHIDLVHLDPAAPIACCIGSQDSRCPCRKLTPEHTYGEVRPGPARPTFDRRPGPRAGSVHPSPVINACGYRCNILDTSRAGDEGAARQTQRHGRGNPAGSIRSAAPHTRSAMATELQSADHGYPSLAAG